MRRPWMKRLQWRSTYLLGRGMQPRIWRSHARQNAFARRIGLTVLTIALNLWLASLLIMGSVAFVLALRDNGLLSEGHSISGWNRQ
jgi:hypothetical protein